MTPTPEPPLVGEAATTPGVVPIPIPAVGQGPLRIVFMGTPDFALTCLDALLASADQVVAVVAQPDKPSGRGNKLTPPPTALRARERAIPLFQPTRLRSGPFPEEMAALRPDLAVVVAYGRILPEALLAVPRLGCINVHGSILPELRGAAPIQWAVLRGMPTTGVTTMMMDAGMDTGDMLRRVVVPIGPTQTSGQLFEALAPVGAQLLLETLAHLKAGTLTRSPQDHGLATSAPMLRKEDGLIDWRRPARELDWHVRGMHPWPTAWTLLGGERLTVHEGLPLPGVSAAAPGVVVGTREGLDVSTGEGVYRILKLQLPGGKALSAAEWLRGHPQPVGTSLSTVATS